MRHTIRFGICAILLLSASLSACHRSDDEPIDECRTYLSRYDQCVHRIDPAAGAMTEKRVEKLRAALDTQTRGASDAKREELRASCVAGLKQLQRSCR